MGTVGFSEGHAAKYVYVIGSGKVALEICVAKPEVGTSTNSPVTVLAAGDAFGWSSLVEPRVLTLTAIAIEHSDIVEINREALHSALGQDQELGCRVMCNLTDLLAYQLRKTRQTFMAERRLTGIV